MRPTRTFRARFAAVRLSIVVAVLTSSFSTNASAAEFIQQRGTKLYAGNTEIRLRGTNLGNWLLQEDFLFGLYGTHTQMRSAMAAVLGQSKAEAFWNEYETVYYTDKDAAYLQQKGFNALRVPINQNRLEDPNHPGVYDEQALRRIDDVIRLSKEHGIYVILDLHAVMGGQSRQIYADSISSIPEFWRYADFRKRATDLWVMLARRYRNEPGVAGYDLMNEPNTQGHTELLTEWLRETHREIRRVDPVHLIWLSGDDWGKGFLGLDKQFWDDPQAAFEFHIYPDFTFPLSKMTDYPQTVDGVRYDKAWLRDHLHEKIEFGRRRHVWLGEFGFSMDHGKIPLLQKMAGDMKTIADEEGWSWTQWTYKDIEEMGLVSPRSDTPWKAFLNSPEVNAERDKARPLIDVRGDGAEDEKLLTKYTAAIGASLDWTNRQNFDLRLERVYDEELSYAILVHLRNRTEEQMRALADSFAYDSCRPNPELTAVF
jgi:endoglucanase